MDFLHNMKLRLNILHVWVGIYAAKNQVDFYTVQKSKSIFPQKATKTEPVLCVLLKLSRFLQSMKTE